MKGLIGILAAVAIVSGSAGCSDDEERTDIVEIEGVRCAVSRDGLGRIRSVGDCEWPDE